jgi:hypothetical protein
VRAGEWTGAKARSQEIPKHKEERDRGKDSEARAAARLPKDYHDVAGGDHQRKHNDRSYTRCLDQHPVRVAEAIGTEIGEVIPNAENQNQRVGEDATHQGVANRGQRTSRCDPGGSDQDCEGQEYAYRITFTPVSENQFYRGHALPQQSFHSHQALALVHQPFQRFFVAAETVKTVSNQKSSTTPG